MSRRWTQNSGIFANVFGNPFDDDKYKVRAIIKKEEYQGESVFMLYEQQTESLAPLNTYRYKNIVSAKSAAKKICNELITNRKLNRKDK